MNFKDFDNFQENIFFDVQAMATTKGKEYAHDESRFANFDRLAKKLALPRMKIWQVYFTKHLDAIDSYIASGKTFSNEGIRGRFIDAITYLTLGLGMITEDSRGPKRKVKTSRRQQSRARARS